MRRRRGTAALASALVGATVLAGCASDESKPEPTATRTVETGPDIITFQVFGPPPVVTAYTKIAADFTAANPDVVVNVRPYDTHAESNKALGTGEPDVFLAERSDLGRLTQDEAIQPVDEMLGERDVDFGDGFQREALEAFSGDDSLLCMPTDTSPMVIYYNTRLVDLAELSRPGEPEVTAETGWNLDQFTQAARQNSRGPLRGLSVEPSLEQVAPFIWSGGGDVVDNLEEPTTLTLSEEESRNALSRLLEVVRDPTVTFSEQQLRRTPALALFKAGRLGMMPGYRSLTPILREQPNLSFDVMPMPRLSRRATSGTMFGLCINAESDYADHVADFIAYAVTEESASRLAGTGYVTPTNLDVLNSDAFLQPGQQPLSAPVFAAATRYIQRVPVGEGWDNVEVTSARLLSQLFFDPVIDPLEARLLEIDENSARIFERWAPPESPDESPDESPTETPTESPTSDD